MILSDKYRDDCISDIQSKYERKVDMSIIKTHDITLYGGCKDDIVLRPLSDEHLPYLYKWNADPEVLYWSEIGTENPKLSYGRETVQQIYGGVSQSQNAFCFLIEANARRLASAGFRR